MLPAYDVELVDIACMEYASGVSSEVIADCLGVSGSAVLTWVRRRGIPVRPKSIAQRTHSCNHNYFFEPLDEERAYWIGFILADGYIGKRCKRFLNITQAMRDKPHLEKFLHAIHATHPVLEMPYRGTCRIEICSDELCEALSRYNIINRKSSTEVSTPSIPDELKRHFYRGLIDGDGCVYHNSKASYEYWQVKLYGRKIILQDYADWIHTALGVRRAEVRPFHSIYEVQHGARADVYRILELLYRGSSVFLDRKMKKALELIG